jgi:hypothetical protein
MPRTLFTKWGTGTAASGEARAAGAKSSFVSFDKDTRLVDNLVLPERLPAWLSPADLDHFVAQFERSGFRGPSTGIATSTGTGR